jgi:ribosomal-protein-alanine N-acetyltransferase
MVRLRLRSGQGDVSPGTYFFALAQTVSCGKPATVHRFGTLRENSLASRLRISTGDCCVATVKTWRAGSGRSPVARRRYGKLGAERRKRPSRYNVAVSIVLRDFHPEDFESLWRMDQECFPPGIAYSKQELREFIQHRGSFTLVAINDKEELQGFIVSHCGTAGHVITIDVGPNARRGGVGSLLLQGAEERMRASGCRAVGLETAVDNISALSFYKRHGYSVIRTWPRYYSNGVDALVLKKDLR